MTDNPRQPKVTFSEAARLAGVHVNTLRNWRKAGRLKTAEMVWENGSQAWTVELEEVLTIQRTSGHKSPDNTNPDISSPNPYQTSQEGLQRPEVEGTLLLIRESMIKPLVEALERQQKENNELSRRIGQLETELEQLKARQEAPQSPPPSPKTVNEDNGPEEKPRRRWPWSK